METQFQRTEMLIGTQNINKLKKSKVAVFGIGGVGGFCVEALVRAGVGNLILIDNDIVCETNINRQIIATHETINKSKVEVMKQRVLSINPNINVEVIQKFYLPNCADEILNLNYDYIVDAIDTVTAKIDLIQKAKNMQIPIISCMGTGNKIDATKFEVADIYETTVCPLARVMRQELRKREIHNLKVVYSKEKPYQLFNTENDRVPASISFIPSVAGLIIAGEAIKDLIGINE